MSGLIGRIFGPAEVVPPPPSVDSRGKTAATPSLAGNVVAPPPAYGANAITGNARGNRKGVGESLGSNVVAPPPSVGMAGGSGHSRSAAPYAGNPNVVPPPPSLAGLGGGTGTAGGGAGAPGGTLLANHIVPPPPSVGGGSGANGSGLGRKGSGFGAPLDAGSAMAPANNGGSGKDAGMIASSQPGPKVGLPANGRTGSLAMSPAGGEKPGLGGAGGGSGIGHGTDSGSGMHGVGSGSGKEGSGRGSDANARGGISPTNGSGGAGNATYGTPPVPGVAISGGSSVTVSFGDGSASEPSSAPRSAVKSKQGVFDAEAVGTASSGGAFEPYKHLLQGEQHTRYLDTSAGTVVMEYSEGPAYSGTGQMVSPQSIRADLPAGLPHARMVVACTLDAEGNLTNIHVLEAGPATMTSKVLGALRSWKFQPATRNNQPVAVTAILGFGIDTNDRF
jgi:TonB family protein